MAVDPRSLVADLRHLRRNRALTLAQAAVGIMHPISLGRVERAINRPQPQTVRALARRYRVPIEEIMDRWMVGYAHLLAERGHTRKPLLRESPPMAATTPARMAATTSAPALVPVPEATATIVPTTVSAPPLVLDAPAEPSVALSAVSTLA